MARLASLGLVALAGICCWRASAVYENSAGEVSPGQVSRAEVSAGVSAASAHPVPNGDGAAQATMCMCFWTYLRHWVRAGAWRCWD